MAYNSNPQYGTYSPPSGVQNFLSYASPIASIAGIGLSAYGSYQQSKAIEEQNELAKQVFEDERQRGLRNEARGIEREGLDRNLLYGGYAQDEEDRAFNQFGSYARQVGL